MISKFIKKLFGKKDELEESTREEKMFNPDLMMDKFFIHQESVYRHQEIVVRRATESNRLKLGEVLSQLFDEKITSVNSMAIAYRYAELDTEVSETIIDDANEIWNYDLFSCILKEKVEDHYTMGQYHETTLVVRCSTNTYIMALTGLNGIDTVKYMRATLLVPDSKNTDDGMSLKTENAPISISFVLSYNELDENPEFAKYDQVEKDVKRKQKHNIDLNELEQRFVDGQFEFQGYAYIGYGKWLFDRNRYYDAFSILERAFNFIRMKKLNTQNQDLMEVYYDICNIMGQCLSKMGREDEASYYFKQGAPGISIDEPNRLALSYAKLGNPAAVDTMNAWMNQAALKYEDFENMPEDIRQFSADVPMELEKYKKQTDRFFSQNPNYNDRVTIGILLKTLIGLNKKNIAPCMFVYDCNSGKFLDRIEGTDKIMSLELNKTEQQGKVFVLSCNHVYYKYETEEDEDKSILCYHAPLVISTHKIWGENTTATMRVDVVRCNFAHNDDKREYGRYNIPLTYTVCLGVSENLDFATDNDSLLAAIRESINYVEERRCFEAYLLAHWVFECTSNKMKSDLGRDYESKDELLWNIFFEASHRTGFCLMEMNKMNTSAYYLEMASHSTQYLHVQEYINFLANSRDPQAISIIEYVMKNSPKPENEKELKSWSSHIAFLKRRKAYALIEGERYEEAGNYISSELLNDPQCAEFARGELNYINELLKKR